MDYSYFIFQTIRYVIQITKKFGKKINAHIFHHRKFAQDEARAKGVIPLKGATASSYELNDKDKKKNEKSSEKLQFCLSIKTKIPREFILSASTEVKCHHVSSISH